jgi:2-oxoglutarate ferredoxin oxidoreductase subunit delta
MTAKGKEALKRVWEYPSREEHPDAVVFIYDKWCKACGICYELCPRGVLTSDKAGKPVVTNPDACTACTICEMLCPDMAITVYKKEKNKGDSDKKGDETA